MQVMEFTEPEPPGQPTHVKWTKNAVISSIHYTKRAISCLALRWTLNAGRADYPGRRCRPASRTAFF